MGVSDNFIINFVVFGLFGINGLVRMVLIFCFVWYGVLFFSLKVIVDFLFVIFIVKFVEGLVKEDLGWKNGVIK